MRNFPAGRTAAADSSSTVAGPATYQLWPMSATGARRTGTSYTAGRGGKVAVTTKRGLARRALSARWLAGTLVALGGISALSAAMVPVRAHITVATAALVLVVPVVAGVAVGGIVSGVVAVGAGFIAFDVLFIPPFGTLDVGAAENWTALGVYAVV